MKRMTVGIGFVGLAAVVTLLFIMGRIVFVQQNELEPYPEDHVLRLLGFLERYNCSLGSGLCDWQHSDRSPKKKDEVKQWLSSHLYAEWDMTVALTREGVSRSHKADSETHVATGEVILWVIDYQNNLYREHFRLWTNGTYSDDEFIARMTNTQWETYFRLEDLRRRTAKKEDV